MSFGAYFLKLYLLFHFVLQARHMHLGAFRTTDHKFAWDKMRYFTRRVKFLTVSHVDE